MHSVGKNFTEATEGEHFIYLFFFVYLSSLCRNTVHLFNLYVLLRFNNKVALFRTQKKIINGHNLKVTVKMVLLVCI